MNLAPASALALSLSFAGASLAGAPPEKLVLVQTESRIEVDATGKVVSIKTTPELPPEVDAAVSANLRKLVFAPPMKDGKPVAGVTYASQDACAAPDNGAFRFVVKYRGNGPSLEQPYAPVYPRPALVAGAESDWQVTYAIATDGKATMLSAKRQDRNKRFSGEFTSAIEQWVAALRFRPELLDGQPVATQMSTRVHFVLTSRPIKLNSPEHHLAEAKSNDSCDAAIAARDDDDRDIALNSPFTPLPAN